MNKELFIKEIEKMGIKITEYQTNQLEEYCSFLLEYNQKTNLTAIKDKDNVYLKHFYDSLTIVKSIDLNKYENLLDIGTGAGFPGMVLKILFPHLNITLLDSNNKKISFLKELQKRLSIEKIQLFHGRAEEYILENREKFDIVTGRAVSNMSILTELALPFVKVGGFFIAMKGSNEEEIKESEEAINILGGKIEKIIKFNLPIENSERNIIKVNKIFKTPKEYPRRYEKIMKNPLKKKQK